VHFDAAHPSHWLRPVARPGRLGLSQPMWAELGPAQKKIYKKNKNNKK